MKPEVDDNIIASSSCFSLKFNITLLPPNKPSQPYFLNTDIESHSLFGYYHSYHNFTESARYWNVYFHNGRNHLKDFLPHLLTSITGSLLSSAYGFASGCYRTRSGRPLLRVCLQFKETKQMTSKHNNLHMCSVYGEHIASPLLCSVDAPSYL